MVSWCGREETSFPTIKPCKKQYLLAIPAFFTYSFPAFLPTISVRIQKYVGQDGSPCPEGQRVLCARPRPGCCPERAWEVRALGAVARLQPRPSQTEAPRSRGGYKGAHSNRRRPDGRKRRRSAGRPPRAA